MALITDNDPYGASEALAQIEAEWPQRITFKGIDYPCVCGDATTKKTLEIGGFSVDYALQVALRRNAFPEMPAVLPAPQDKILFAGKSFRVDSIIESADNSVLTLLCVDDSRGV